MSPEDPDSPQLLLEPAGHPAVPRYRDALAADGIPLAEFAVEDVTAEYERLREAGGAFTQPPTDIGTAIVAVLFEAVARLGECSVEGIDLAAQSGP